MRASGASGGGLRAGIEEIPVGRLRVWPANPRVIGDVRFGDLMHSMREDPAMLWARPLVALLDGTVFLGNQRLRAAKELGWATVPVLFVDLGRARAALWALRDNNTYGDWDEPALAELLAGLASGDLDLALTGFASGDLDRLLAGMPAASDPDEAPSLSGGEPQSEPGQVYELGRHRLLCGDATDPAQVEALLAGERVEMLCTDPPYGVDYVGKTAEALRIRNDEGDRLAAFLGEAFSAVDQVLVPSGRFYVFCPAGPRGTDFRLAVQEFWWLHQTLVWVKNAIVLGHSDYHYQHEELLYGWKRGEGRPGRGRQRGSRWYADNKQGSVFFVDRPARSAEHPTMKPVPLLASLLRNSSRRGETVLDPFAGAGSTLIAAEQLGRRCFSIEIDPRYCDVIRRRYLEYTNG